jgi:acetate kinase
MLVQKIGSSLPKKYILALNAGSSSLKASLMEQDSLEVATKVFLAERLNTPSGVVHLPSNQFITETNLSHERALEHIIAYLKGEHLLDHLVAIGHRVVHGGTTFTSSVVVKEEELQLIKNVSRLAPL